MSGEHLKVPIRRVASVVNGGTPTPKESNWGGTIPWATPVDLGLHDGGVIRDTERAITAEGLRSGSALVPHGSVILSTRAPVGYSAIADGSTSFNQGCKGLVLKDAEFDPRFFRYSIDVSLDDLRSFARGSTFLEVNSSDVSSLLIPWCAAWEQKRIADYLDHETAEIDALIADFESARTLLNEARSSQIDQSVWRGASKTLTIRRVLKAVGQGLSPLADSAPAGPGEVGVLKAGCTNGGVFDVSANKKVLSEDAFTSSMFISPGDLIVTRASGSLRHVGSAAIVPPLDRRLAMSDKHYRLSVDSFYDSRFLALVMNSARFRAMLEPEISGADGLARNISISTLKGLSVPNVPLSFQSEVVVDVDDRLEVIQEALGDIDFAVGLMFERRVALITAAVTGQIDVTAKHKPVAEQLEDELAEAR